MSSTEVARIFDYFVIIASMRTGSNLLEERLAEHPDIRCHGELFNPNFVGRPEQDQALGLTRQARDADPKRLIDAVRKDAGAIGGFRLFDDHDPRALDLVLDDPRCAKIVLTRNPAESYVSLKIARKTGQWWLGDHGHARSESVDFDPDEFLAYLKSQHEFRGHVRLRMQISGQSAFQISYDELSAPPILAGIFLFLGLKPIEKTKRARSKVQNPVPLTEKITNPDEMRATLSALDPFDLERIPDFEPTRGAGVPQIRLAATEPVMFQSLPGVRPDAVDDWLTRISRGQRPIRGLTQNALRKWMRENPGHRRFSVISHPVPRAFDAFWTLIVKHEDGTRYDRLRGLLERDYGLARLRADTSPELLREGFAGFLRYLKANLGGQSSHRVDPIWASQSNLLASVCSFAVPDFVIRQNDLGKGLARISADLGVGTEFDSISVDRTFTDLAGLYDAEVERAVRSIYRRDYINFGFSDWSAD